MQIEDEKRNRICVDKEKKGNKSIRRGFSL